MQPMRQLPQLFFIQILQNMLSTIALLPNHIPFLDLATRIMVANIIVVVVKDKAGVINMVVIEWKG